MGISWLATYVYETRTALDLCSALPTDCDTQHEN